MASFVWGLVGGIVAWVTTTLLGQPLYRFINLRANAAEVLARYERRDPNDPGRDATDASWICLQLAKADPFHQRRRAVRFVLQAATISS
jgi:hypothetical protein